MTKIKEKIKKYVEAARETNRFERIAKELDLAPNSVDFFKIRGTAEALGLVKEGYGFGAKKKIRVTDKGKRLVEEDVELDFSNIIKKCD